MQENWWILNVWLDEFQQIYTTPLNFEFHSPLLSLGNFIWHEHQLNQARPDFF